MHSESKTRFVPTLIISWCVNLYCLFEKTIIAWNIWVNPWTCDQFDSVLKILMIQTSQKEQFIFVLEPLLKAVFPLHIPESEKLHFLSFYLHFFSASLQKNRSKDVKWEADSLEDIWDSLLLCQVLHALYEVRNHQIFLTQTDGRRQEQNTPFQHFFAVSNKNHINWNWLIAVSIYYYYQFTMQKYCIFYSYKILCFYSLVKQKQLHLVFNYCYLTRCSICINYLLLINNII